MSETFSPLLIQESVDNECVPQDLALKHTPLPKTHTKNPYAPSESYSYH